MNWKNSLLAVICLITASCASEPEIVPRDANKASDLNAELGMHYMIKGQMETARHKLKKAVAQNPDNPTAHHYFAEFHRRTGKMEKAETHFKRALELSPNETSLLNNYGVFLCDKKKYAEAMKHFFRVLDDPVYQSRERVFENIGLCAYRKGNQDMAVQYLDKALKRNPKLPQSRITLAQLRYNKQQYTVAYHHFKEYLQLSKHTAESLWIGHLLEKQRGNESAAKSYGIRLKVKFPDSPEAHRLRQLEARGGA